MREIECVVYKNADSNHIAVPSDLNSTIIDYH